MSCQEAPGRGARGAWGLASFPSFSRSASRRSFLNRKSLRTIPEARPRGGSGGPCGFFLRRLEPTVGHPWACAAETISAKFFANAQNSLSSQPADGYNCRAWPCGLPGEARPYGGLPYPASLREAQMGKRLYVGNLSYDATDERLREIFE